MTVAKAIEELLPSYSLVYFGDMARSPYGSKSPETIRDYSRQNTRFLLAQGARIIIIACNSAASVAADQLKEEFPVPVFEVINPAVIKAVRTSRNGRIGVIGTRATIRSGVYEEKIMASRADFRVFSQACPLLVPLVEEGWLNRRETRMILKNYLYPFKLKQIDTFVLGCTHYPLLKKLIQPKIGKGVQIIDSSEELAAGLKAFLASHPEIDNELRRDRENRYFVSDVTDAASATAQMIFGRKIELVKARAEG